MNLTCHSGSWNRMGGTTYGHCQGFFKDNDLQSINKLDTYEPVQDTNPLTDGTFH